MVLLLIVTQSHLLIQNLLEGLIWLVVPAMMVVFNDCFAYICGFFFGRTPLIKVIIMSYISSLHVGAAKMFLLKVAACMGR